MFSSAKRYLSRFLHTHVTDPLCAAQREVIFQQLFDVQCRNRGITNDFYPVGAAASFGLMYFLLRVLSELDVRTIIELGSGQSTLLVDRAKNPGTRHVCYEHDPSWHDLLSHRLTDCDYRLRPLEHTLIEGRKVMWYSGVEIQGFDLLLVDGPGGVDRFSRFGCAQLITSSVATDFLVVFDDCERDGERETVAWVADHLRAAGREFRLNYLESRKTQAIISGGRFVKASFYY